MRAIEKSRAGAGLPGRRGEIMWAQAPAAMRGENTEPSRACYFPEKRRIFLKNTLRYVNASY